MNHVQDEVIYAYMVMKYKPTIWKKTLRIEKGIPVKWFYLMKERYREKYDIENIIIE